LSLKKGPGPISAGNVLYSKKGAGYFF